MTNTLNTRRLRCTIGWLGIVLPWLVVLLIGFFPPSISFTWYTNACTPFMIILGSAGLLLFNYKGYDWIDDVLCTLAGIFALGICLFPCAVSTDTYGLVTGTFLIPMAISGLIHNISAGGFFGILAFMSIFRFTKTSKTIIDIKKKIRNIIFIVCGIGMIISFIMLAYGVNVWLVEAIALFFFGISWLTKANCYPWLFADKK